MGARVGERLEVRIVAAINSTLLVNGTPSAWHGFLLAVELWAKWTLSTRYHIERLDETMSTHSTTHRRRIVPSDALHFLAACLGTGTVIANQVSGHDGLLSDDHALWGGPHEYRHDVVPLLGQAEGQNALATCLQYRSSSRVPRTRSG